MTKVTQKKTELTTKLRMCRRSCTAKSLKTEVTIESQAKENQIEISVQA